MIISDERLKEAKLATNNDLNIVEQHTIRNEVKIEKLQRLDLSYFFDETFFGNDYF